MEVPSHDEEEVEEEWERREHIEASISSMSSDNEVEVDEIVKKTTTDDARNYTLGQALVMCDISKKYRFHDNFVDIVIVSIFDTALADFDIYRKGNILR